MIAKKPLVLIVDDLKSNRMVVKKALTSSYDFVEACNGLEALKVLNSYTPDIILIDAIMPKMDGFETIKTIREMPKYTRTPILMITSLGDMKTKLKAIEHGVNDFLTKPFDKYELRARCKSYVNLVKISKRYSDARISHRTGFYNEIALIEDLVPNDKIFLFYINDFHKIDSIYGYKTSVILEKKIGEFIKNLVSDYLGDIDFYQVRNSRFLVRLRDNKNFANDEIENLCEEFYNIFTNTYIDIDTLQYMPIPTIVFTKDRVNLYEDAMSSASYAYRNNLKYLNNSDDINGIKDIVYSNIEVLKKVKVAIENHSVINYYQPILNNNTNKIDKYETLIRLKCKDGNTLSPLEFLNISKDTKIYEEITKTVYKNAFDNFKFNNKDFSINISYQDIQNKVVKEYILNILKNNPHVSNRVIFEIQEDYHIKDYKLLLDFIDKIKQYDAKITIDNFGSHSTNLKQIVEINPDYIKIDGSIVKNIIHDSKNYTLLEGIHNFAQNLNIKTIAEHISSEDIQEEALNIGIDYSQGYFIGKPEVELLEESCLI